MGLLTEVWLADVREQLFANADFITKSVSHDEFVNKKTVNVPQAGTLPAVQKNRTVIPATITERTDSNLTYDLDEYTTDPIVVKDLDELQTSYNKRASVLGQHMNKLNDRLALEAAYSWATDTTARIRRTSGTAVNSNLAPGATGTRKAVTVADIAMLAKIFDEDNVPENNRFLLMPPGMYYDLFTIDNLLRKDIMDRTALPQGVVNTVLGFNVIKRSYSCVYDAAPVRKAVGAATAVTDNWGAIAWQGEQVGRALGEVAIYDDIDSPTMYGSVFSALIMFGTKILRSDSKGIATLVQTA